MLNKKAKRISFAQAHGEFVIAREKMQRAFREAFPIGSSVSWEWSGQIYRGHVVLLGYGDRIKVANSTTGKERWVRVFNLLDGGGDVHD